MRRQEEEKVKFENRLAEARDVANLQKLGNHARIDSDFIVWAIH